MRTGIVQILFEDSEKSLMGVNSIWSEVWAMQKPACRRKVPASGLCREGYGRL